MTRNASFEIVGSSAALPLPNIVLRDLGPWDRFPTITNAAEEVVASLAKHGRIDKATRVFYYDSEGDLSELQHDGVSFLGFAPTPKGAWVIAVPETRKEG